MFLAMSAYTTMAAFQGLPGNHYFVSMASVCNSDFSSSLQSPLEGKPSIFYIFWLITFLCYMSYSRCWCCLAGTDSDVSGSGRLHVKVPVSAAGSLQGCPSSPTLEGKLDTRKHAPAEKHAKSAKAAASSKSGAKRKAL